MRPSNTLTSIVPIIAVLPAIIAAPTVEVIKRGYNALEPRKYFFNYWVILYTNFVYSFFISC